MSSTQPTNMNSQPDIAAIIENLAIELSHNIAESCAEQSLPLKLDMIGLRCRLYTAIMDSAYIRPVETPLEAVVIDNQTNIRGSPELCETAIFSEFVDLDSVTASTHMIETNNTLSDDKNLCMGCGVDMGSMNPRQLCGKTYCMNNDSSMM